MFLTNQPANAPFGYEELYQSPSCPPPAGEGFFLRGLLKTFAIAALAVFFSHPSLHAGTAQSAGSQLLGSGGAKAHALGDAYSTGQDDIIAFPYNAASLATLKTGQASFLYRKGLADDSHSQFMIGSPTQKGGLGLVISHFDAGDFVYTDGVNRHTANAQRDILLALGYAKPYRKMSFGGAVKYLSSELADQFKAHAVAFDAGLGLPASPKMNLAFSLQNFGSGLRYNDETDALPRAIRSGLSYRLFTGKYPTTAFLELPYLLNEKELRNALGLESRVGPLAVRAGYMSGRELQKFTVGAGFYFGRLTFDYALGLVDKLDARHLVSVSFRFGESANALFADSKNRALSSSTSTFKSEAALPSEAMEKIGQKNKISFPRSRESKRRFRLDANGNILEVGKKRGVREVKTWYYTVKPGDTLETIAVKFYGKKDEWKRIYHGNRSLLDKPRVLVGQEIILP